ncbi:hypothetical protein S7711_11359 [Stachybotrys chartarum IBT 7711]|uniref:Uncharacterized protein n=1 Tax=Stachybotrys chartarum (strain CBS 109288 / IBT 7711) TaxID=1280523 RepID=A0A084B2Z0_STACB|nr:hypothetical protein S7711_11359 [Stachybotrys chartarum IBT 7711]KFA56356.1 hypothetical protein S40293_11294 [Stachybotrys chartarum IBT 40293]
MDTVERRIPKRWTDAEDNVLYREARSQLANGQVKDWNRIAAKLPGRTNKDCRKRWINKVCGSLKKGVWDEDEDERLREAVRVHGQKWAIIANIVGLRSPDQCAKRWQYSLDPRLDHGGWSPEEDEFLVTLVQAHGRDWKLLHEQEFPTRSRNELKNRYSTLMRKPSTANGGESRSSCSAPSPVSRILDETPQQSAEGETGPVLADAGAENGTYQNNPDTQMQWEDTKTDGMLIDTWVDSLGADWMQHMGTPFSGSPASAVLSSSDGSSSSGSTMAVDKTGAQQPETLAPTAVMKSSKDINDAMHNSSPLQWPSGASDAAAQSTFFPLDHTGTSEWTPADSTLVMETHLQQSPMVLTSGRQDSIHEALGAEGLLARSNSALKRISLTVDQCDANTLEDLLSCVKKLKGKVKLEIDV